MARSIVIEEFWVTAFVPRRLDAAECKAIRRTLTGTRFRKALEQAVQATRERYPSLRKVRITVSR